MEEVGSLLPLMLTPPQAEVLNLALDRLFETAEGDGEELIDRTSIMEIEAALLAPTVRQGLVAAVTLAISGIPDDALAAVTELINTMSSAVMSGSTDVGAIEQALDRLRRLRAEAMLAAG